MGKNFLNNTNLLKFFFNFIQDTRLAPMLSNNKSQNIICNTVIIVIVSKYNKLFLSILLIFGLFKLNQFFGDGEFKFNLKFRRKRNSAT